MDFGNMGVSGIEDAVKLYMQLFESADLTLGCIVGKLSWEIS
jgi:hypothetical protein